MISRTTNFDNCFPEELRQRRQWMHWQYDDHGQKIPYAVDGRWGKSNDPDYWSTLDEALHHQGQKGIAYVFSADDPYCGVDLDDCLTDGEFTPLAVEILERFRGLAYGEISPSGSGLKLITKATKPAGSRCQSKQVECYDHGRFWTMTGRVLENFESIGDGQDAVEWLLAEHLPKAKGNLAGISWPSLDSFVFPTSSKSIYERAKAYCDAVPGAQQGELRNSAFKLSGKLHAITDDTKSEKLSVGEVLGLLQSWNLRNESLLRLDELQEAARNGEVNGTPPAPKLPRSVSCSLAAIEQLVSEQAVDDIAVERPAIERLRPVGVDLLLDNYPSMRPPVVHGLLRQGEVANVIAGPKTGKSFLAGNLAWCVATGIPWLSHDVEQGRVLIIDNELHPETLAHRLTKMADGLYVPLGDRDLVDVVSLRGKNAPISMMQAILDIEPGRYQLVVIDALYRSIPEGVSENDNAQMMQIYNHLDRLATAWQSAVVIVHHASKGDQSHKSITDVGAGAGSISRAADLHMIIRPHEVEGHHVLDIVTRSFAPASPVSLVFEFPVWHATTLDPEVKRPTGRADERQARQDREADEKLEAAIDDCFVRGKVRGKTESDIERATGMGPSRVKRAIARALESGKIEEKRVLRRGRKIRTYVRFATAFATR